jgi:2-methylcitrate dehydratase PrpD
MYGKVSITFRICKEESGGKMAEIMDRISQFIRETEYKDLPESTINYTKRIVLSCLGGTIAGAVQPTSKILKKYVQQKGGNPEAGVIYYGMRVPVAEAGLCNATFAHASELEDDSFPEGCLIYNLVPSVLALGEYELFRKEVESIIVGYDVQAKSALYSGSWAKDTGDLLLDAGGRQRPQQSC